MDRQFRSPCKISRQSFGCNTRKTGKKVFLGKIYAKTVTHGRSFSITPQIDICSRIASLGPHAKFENNPLGAIQEERKKPIFWAKIAQKPMETMFQSLQKLACGLGLPVEGRMQNF